MIGQSEILYVLDKSLKAGADFAELFFEDKSELNIRRENGTIRGITQATLHGVGLYLLSGTASAYCFTSDTSVSAISGLLEKAKDILRTGIRETPAVRSLSPVNALNPCPVKVYPSSIPHAQKVRVLAEVEKATFSASRDVKHVLAEYFDTEQGILVVNTEGVWAEDRRVFSRLRLTPTLVNEKGTSSRWKDFVRPMGFEAFADGRYVLFAQKLVKDIRDNMFADEAPGGYLPVVFEAGQSGVFFHEACGHQLEAQSVADGSSVFVGRLGEKVASERVTLIDDGSYPGLYGSAAIDDEGMPCRPNVLIENGILRSYLVDHLGSRKLNVSRTASGRRQGYWFAPAARMSNTYLAPGTDDEEEMIRTLGEGLFVTQLGGGTGGPEFTVMAQQAYLIKNGQIDREVKGAMLVGKGAEALLKIDRVGRSLKLDEDGGGFCGGASGLCPTTAFQPRVRVMGMIVGGKGKKL